MLQTTAEAVMLQTTVAPARPQRIAATANSDRKHTDNISDCKDTDNSRGRNATDNSSDRYATDNSDRKARRKQLGKATSVREQRRQLATQHGTGLVSCPFSVRCFLQGSWQLERQPIRYVHPQVS